MSLILGSWFALLVVLPTTARPDAPPLELEALIDEALRLNPSLRAIDSDRLAASERAVAAGAWPDPSLGVAMRSVPIPSFSLDEDMMTMGEVMLSQRIPWFGKQGLRREAEGMFASVLAEEGRALRLELAERVTGAYAELWLALASREVLERRALSLGRLAQLARSRLASGGTRQAEVLRAELELERVEIARLELTEREEAARAELAALLSSPAPLAGAPTLPRLAALPEPAALLEGLERHPELRALELREEQARLTARLASKERWPDPEVGISYGVRAGAPDLVGAEVTIPLPIFAGSKQDRLAAAARAEAAATAARRRARGQALGAQVRAAWAAARREELRLEHQEAQLLPRAERGLQASLGAYESGGVDYLAVLDAELQRSEQELEVLGARAALLRERARLARAAGSLHHFLNTFGASDE